MGAVSAPRVSVVIPTHDRWPMMRTALWCALNQEGVDTRVIVVDDGSTSETSDRLAPAARDAITLVQARPPGGVSNARNLGLEHVDTERVAFLDDDDVWAPNHLADLLAVAVPAEADLAYSGSVTITLDRDVMHVRPAPPVEGLRHALYAKNEFLTPSSVLLRTEAVRAVQGFDTELSVTADWDLWLRLLPRARVAASPALSVGYTRHPQNLHLGVDKALRELPRLEEKHAAGLRAHDRTFTDNCAGWIAASYRATGRRRQALAWYLRAFRAERQPRDLGRALGMLLGERAIELSGMKGNHEVSLDAAPWLRDLRRIDRLPPDEIPFAPAA